MMEENQKRHIQCITSKEEHEVALAEIDRLILCNPSVGSEDAERLSALGALVELYELAQFPIGHSWAGTEI